MGSFSFIHAADLHLDSPFKGVTAQESRVAEALRSATFEAFDALVGLCIEQKIDFLLVAGDVYDGADRSVRAQLRFRDGLEKLSRHGIRSCVVHGNHDALDGWCANIAWPEGARVFGAEQVETEVLAVDGKPSVAVSGISYAGQSEKRNLAQHFAADGDGLFHIGLLHCNCGGNAQHDNYAPCQTADLAGAGLHYWALGHVHERDILHEDPWIVYPGNTQGRSIRETGPRGCYRVTVRDGHLAETQFHALDTVRWLRGELDVAGRESMDALDAAVRARVEALQDEAEGRPLVCRLRLTGRSPLYRELAREGSVAGLLERLRENVAGEEPFVWVEALECACRPELDLAPLRAKQDLVAQVLHAADALRGDLSLGEALAPPLSELFGHARASRVLNDLAPEELSAILDDAELMCLYLLTEDDA